MRLGLFTLALVLLVLSSEVWPPAIGLRDLSHVSIGDGLQALLSALLALAGCLAAFRLIGRLRRIRPISK